MKVTSFKLRFIRKMLSMKLRIKMKILILSVLLVPSLLYANDNALSLGSWQSISRDEAGISANGIEGKVRLRKVLKFLDNPNTFAEVLVFDNGTLLFRHDKNLASIPGVSNKQLRKNKILRYLDHPEIKPLRLKPFKKVSHEEYSDSLSGGMVMLSSTIAKGASKTCFLFYKAKVVASGTVSAESAEGVFCKATKKIPSMKDFIKANYTLARSFVFDKGRHAKEFAVSALAEKLDKYYLNTDQKGPKVTFSHAEHIPSGNRFIMAGKIIDRTGVGFIKLNGVRLSEEQMQTALKKDGSFSFDVRVNGGRPGVLNMVFADRARNATIKAFGKDVKTTRKGSRPASPAAITLNKSTGRGTTYALLAAVGSYQDKSLSSLFSPVPDVKRIAGALASVGVKKQNIFTLFNPNKSRFIDTIDKIKKKFKEGDQLVVYYSGHGVLSAKTNEGYWSFRDTAAEPMRPNTWLSNNELRKRLLEYTKGGVLVVADSCFSGSFVKHYFDNASSLKFNHREEARTTLTSGGVSPVADTASGNSINSEFAVSFLQALKRMKVEARKRNETDVPGFFLYGLTAKQQRLKHQPLPNYGSFVDVLYIDRKTPDFSLNIN